MPTRQSPVQHLLESHAPEFRDFGGGSYVVRLRAEQDEQQSLESLGLCDLSGLQKLGLKGPDARAVLEREGLDVPGEIFESRPLPDGGVIVRIGVGEFFLEDNIANSNLPTLLDRIDAHDGQLYRVEHQEATFLLVGHRVVEVLAQTCGINFAETMPSKVVFTRVAGVSCGILPETIRDTPAYRLWIDPSYAVYVWETLSRICEGLDGSVIGAGCIYSELSG